MEPYIHFTHRHIMSHPIFHGTLSHEIRSSATHAYARAGGEIFKGLICACAVALTRRSPYTIQKVSSLLCNWQTPRVETEERDEIRLFDALIQAYNARYFDKENIKDVLLTLADVFHHEEDVISHHFALVMYSFHDQLAAPGVGCFVHIDLGAVLHSPRTSRGVKAHMIRVNSMLHRYSSKVDNECAQPMLDSSVEITMPRFKIILSMILRSLDVSDEAIDALVRFVENEDIAPDDLGCVLNRRDLESIMKKGPVMRIEQLRDRILDRLVMRAPLVEGDMVQFDGQHLFWIRYTDDTEKRSILEQRLEGRSVCVTVRTDKIKLII